MGRLNYHVFPESLLLQNLGFWKVFKVQQTKILWVFFEEVLISYNLLLLKSRACLRFNLSWQITRGFKFFFSSLLLFSLFLFETEFDMLRNIVFGKCTQHCMLLIFTNID